MYNPFTLKGKTILVTGASSGIGRATAVECSRMGALVIAHGRDAARLDETMSMLEGTGHVSICADLTDEEQVRYLTGGLRPVDGLVHCAGMSALKPIQFLKDSELHGIFATNTFSAMMLQKHLLRLNKRYQGKRTLMTVSFRSGFFYLKRIFNEQNINNYSRQITSKTYYEGALQRF